MAKRKLPNVMTERIYRDDRFPGLEIRNHGGPTFNIWVEGESDYRYHSENGWTNTDCFTHYSTDWGDKLPADEAERYAQEHFDEMAELEKSWKRI